MNEGPVLITYLDLFDLLQLVEDLQVGPVRDLGLLASAVARPATRLYGYDAYESLDLKAAALLESLARNHSLVDGNKRLGFLALLVFFDINGVEVEVSDDEAYDLVISVVEGKSSLPDVAQTLSTWHR